MVGVPGCVRGWRRIAPDTVTEVLRNDDRADLRAPAA